MANTEMTLRKPRLATLGLLLGYGPSYMIPRRLPTEADFVDRLTNRGVPLHFSWSWPTGERVILSIGKAEPESDAAIRIDYTRPVRKVAANGAAL